VRDTIAYVAAALIAAWGIAHAAPTRQVIDGFQPTSRDNTRVITQEWLAEALTMWGLAAITIAATAAGPPTTADWVYRIGAALLVAIAAHTTLTGARTHVIWFKVCPVVLTTSAVLLVAASLT
jgi:hypothetical protein